MSETLLSGDNTAEPQIDPTKDYFAELVGEGKKFKDPKALAVGKMQSDLYIKTLERQQDELRKDYQKLSEDYKTRASLEEIIDKMDSRAKQPQGNTPANEPVDKQPGFDPKQIESLVSNKIQEHETVRKQTDNFNVVKEKLREKYGDNYQNALKQQIDDLGLSADYIDDLARKSPNAVIKSLGLDAAPNKDPFQAPIRNTVNPSSFRQKGPTQRTRQYYLDLKKNDPKRYYDPKTNVEMHNDAMTLGQAFFDVEE